MTNLNSCILILDADQIPALTILRSLSKQGLRCDLAGNDDRPISGYSRYAKHFFRYPNPLTNSEDFIDRVAELITLNHYDLVIPVTERSMIPLAQSPKMKIWRDQLAIAPSQALNQVLDKSKTLTLAAQLGIPIPTQHVVDHLDLLFSLTSQVNYPIVIKPQRSISVADHRHQLGVCYAHNSEELIKKGQNLLNHSALLIQDYVPGLGTGIELLADHGEIIYAFQHQRLHELPLTGGGSCYRKSVRVNPILLEASRQLIKALNWHGVAMVEFKWQPETGQFWLMEINGRFWGSLPLACVSGADFPYMLYQLIVKNQHPEKNKYQESIYCRKLSADIYWYEQIIRRNDDNRLVNYPSKKKMLGDLIFMFHPTRHFFDVQQWSDPLPSLMDLYRIGCQYTQRLSDIFSNKALGLWHCSAWKQKALQNHLKTTSSVLFLCYGNINRSAIAEHLAPRYFKNRNFCFESAGFHPVTNRPADPMMCQISAEHGLDLSTHASKTVNKKQIRQSDLIFVMERQQYRYIKTHYPEAIHKVFLLGSLNGKPDIEDPYHHPEERYRVCFTVIDSALKKLAALTV